MDLLFDEDPKWVKWRRIEPKVIGYGSIARVELIRERHPETFSQYDNGTWENQRFQKDLLTLKAVLPTPNCKHRIAQLVDSCTKMRQTERATIDSIYPQIVHLNLEYQKFPFFPLICEKQKQLLRPIGFDNRLTKAVESPQSDIYQIGLVLWEIVERRTVYEDYGETEMNLDRFLFDCRKNSVKLNSPDSLHPIREIIETCTKIDCKERSSALTHHKLDYGRFEMDPLIRETQERLIRPIGFDGTENEVNVDNREGVDVNSSFLPPGIFISGASTLNEY
ncbi:unnamed protein product, partial [Mesorhabditis belari]|uniref:Protein kinase domain-containing protein n=1 Tax=Mesorhabditis belari TaxID=2138241 RepID=A0AAF3J3V1_9BILA